MDASTSTRNLKGSACADAERPDHDPDDAATIRMTARRCSTVGDPDGLGFAGSFPGTSAGRRATARIWLRRPGNPPVPAGTGHFAEKAVQAELGPARRKDKAQRRIRGPNIHWPDFSNFENSGFVVLQPPRTATEGPAAPAEHANAGPVAIDLVVPWAVAAVHRRPLTTGGAFWSRSRRAPGWRGHKLRIAPISNRHQAAAARRSPDRQTTRAGSGCTAIQRRAPFALAKGLGRCYTPAGLGKHSTSQPGTSAIHQAFRLPLTATGQQMDDAAGDLLCSGSPLQWDRSASPATQARPRHSASDCGRPLPQSHQPYASGHPSMATFANLDSLSSWGKFLSYFKYPRATKTQPRNRLQTTQIG